MFLDEKELLIRAGKGGDGVALFRREIYVPRGGPDGGDGGQGGSIYVVGKNNLHTLAHLSHTDKLLAQDGAKGGHRTSTGKSGEDLELLVPLGTIITSGGETVVEITEENQKVLLVKGGNGGWGNWHFRSSITQAPDRFNPGQAGEEMHIHLTLKLIADVGLVGLPNAGKSTLLSVISAAEPKIANYPFTTLEPQLGVAQVDGKNLVVADLPGLIEGASGGKGLGATFLKHIERTRSIAHCISFELPEDEMLAVYNTIRHELEQWSEALATKNEVIVLTKADILLPEEVEARCASLTKKLKKPVFAISAASHQGLEDLLRALV